MKRVSIILIGSMVLLSMLLAACSAATPTAAPTVATTVAPTEAPTATATALPKIRVATDATFKPYEYMDDSGNMVGIDIDLMTQIAAKIGVQVEWSNLPFDSAMAGISECQYDASIAGIYITDLRKQSMLFTDAYANAGLSVTINASNTTINGLSDLKGKTVAAQLGTSGEEEAKKIENVKYKPYDSYELAFLDLANGQVDAVIADTPVAQGYVKANSAKLKIAGEPFNSADYGIAVCKTETALRDRMNTALQGLIKDGTVETIIKKYNP